MRISNKPWFRSLEDQLYMDMMVEKLKSQRVLKPKPVKPEGMTDEEFLLSLQAPSTKGAMLAQKTRDPMDDIAWANRPLSTEGQMTLKTGLLLSDDDRDKAVNRRIVTERDIDLNERTKVKRNKLGESQKSATTPEKKYFAENMYQLHPTGLEKKETWKEVSMFVALIEWLKGKKVRRL